MPQPIKNIQTIAEIGINSEAKRAAQFTINVAVKCFFAVFMSFSSDWESLCEERSFICALLSKIDKTNPITHSVIALANPLIYVPPISFIYIHYIKKIGIVNFYIRQSVCF